MEDGEIEEGPVTVVDEQEPQQDAQSTEQSEWEKSPYEMLQNSKDSVEKIITEMLSIKREGLPKSHLRELVTQMFLNFVTLRQVPILLFYLLCCCRFITNFVVLVLYTNSKPNKRC